MKKRIISLLLALMMATTLILSAVPAQAAQTITVYVKAPTDWDQVYLYVWENGDMSTWPGTPMTKNGDWWTLEIPADSYTNVIANDGTNQTADLKMDGSADCWIDADAGVVYTDAACTTPFGDETSISGLYTLAIVGIGIPGVSEWNPGDPAGDMVEVSEGVWTKVISVTADTTMIFKFAGNDMWNDDYNWGSYENGTVLTLGTPVDMISEGGSRDIALTVDYDCNIKFTITIHQDGATLLVEETDEEPPAPPQEPEEMITVYARVPNDWTDVRVWAWNKQTDETVNQEYWPGELLMTMGENGWYSVQIPAWATGVLLHANGASIQTPDMTNFQPGVDIWIDAYTDYSNPTVHYEEIIIVCQHSSHGSDGSCLQCGEYLGHEYNKYYTCTCGAYCNDLKTVYFIKTDSFSSAYVYWQYDDYYDWTLMPGVMMDYEGDDIYSAEVPANAVYITFNDNWDTEVRTQLSGMSATRNVFDPIWNMWITYDEAVPPEEEPPVTQPTEPEPTIPSRNDDDVEDDDDDDDDRKATISVSTSGDPTWIFVTLAALTVAGMVVLLILTLKKKK